MITLREASKIIPAVKMNERRGFLHAGHVLKLGVEVPVTSVTSDLYY